MPAGTGTVTGVQVQKRPDGDASPSTTRFPVLNWMDLSQEPSASGWPTLEERVPGVPTRPRRWAMMLCRLRGGHDLVAGVEHHHVYTGPVQVLGTIRVGKRDELVTGRPMRVRQDPCKVCRRCGCSDLDDSPV
jgi:hypothetical protein